MTAADQIARYVMIGGFLGAGKTTAVDRMARLLAERGLRVGLITNDQSSGLVDTALLRSRGHVVEEIAGGCFCCRFDSLQRAAGRLDERTRPDVFLAEPVGSCTDLVATVSYPLRRIYGDRFRIAPLSVLVDPRRAARILGVAGAGGGRAFSDKVSYVYRKQLEEADLIVVNKCDATGDELREALVEALAERFPAAEVRAVSAREGSGVEAWLEAVLAGEAATRATMELDYDLYAEGEALLGWLNATLVVEAARPFDANALLLRLTDALRERITAENGAIAHLKLTLDAGDALGQLAVVSVVHDDAEPDLRETLLDTVAGGELVVNLRAELAPERLSALLAEVVTAASGDGLTLRAAHEESFRPARPVPTHRLTVDAP